jgi:Tol biopolymer transport system component
MRSGRPVKLLLGVSIAGFFTLICVSSLVAYWLLTGRIAEETVLRAQPLLNQIAVVGNDGNLWLMDPDSGRARRLTDDGRGYRLPTWAPNGRRLAFLGPDGGRSALFVQNGTGDRATLLFSDAEASPFYVYWAPDSRSVTFLTQESSELAMRITQVDDPQTNRVLAMGSPLYWVWSPVGDQLLMHVGGSRSFSQEAHISFLEKAQGAQRIELKLAPGSFQAPVWSQDGGYVFYVAEASETQEGIFRTDMNSSQQRLITLLEGPAFLTLSPDDRFIAYLELREVERVPALGTAFLVDTMGEGKREILADWVVGLYWSPNGKKLALLTLADSGQSPTTRAPGLAAPSMALHRYRLWIYEPEEDKLAPLLSFAPTLDFLQTVPYFDQYDLSLTFWSPDSRYFVIARREDESQQGSIWILDTQGGELPRRMGDGTLAVWSWR